MRPIGDIRWIVEAQFACAVDLSVPTVDACMSMAPLAAPDAGLTWRDVADAIAPLGVSRGAARHTVKNMARAGVLEPVGVRPARDSARPLVAFRMAAPAGGPSGALRARHDASAAAAALVQAVNSWAAFV